MEPLIRPLSREDPVPSSRRAAMDRIRRQHYGTLNLFATHIPPEDPPAPPSRRRLNHNTESCETREFLWPHLRRVPPQQHDDPPRGIQLIPRAAALVQNIQVVGVTPAYKDPHNMATPRNGLRCSSRSHSSSMRDVLSYAAGREDTRPVGRPSSARCRVVAYSPQERFCQAVRDHAQHRRGGVTQFYVQLARGRVGRASAQAQVPTPREWRLEDEPVTHTLSLAACREQLVSLVGIAVSLAELADILWDTEDLKASMGGALDEEQLSGLTVSYRDFSAAFGDNSNNVKLATLKI